MQEKNLEIESLKEEIKRKDRIIKVLKECLEFWCGMDKAHCEIHRQASLQNLEIIIKLKNEIKNLEKHLTNKL